MDPNIYSISSDTISVSFPKYFRNKIWAEKYGGLPNILFGDSIEFTGLKLDFAKCRWIDPMPLISILVQLRQQRKFAQGTITFFLPNVDSEGSQRILLKFLFEEGYIAEMKQIGRINLSDAVIASIENIPARLNYFDCQLLKVKLLDAKEFQDNDKYYDTIERLYQEISTNINNKNVPIYVVNDLLFRIKTFLAETLINVQQHAYPFDENKAVGVYARFRYGLQNKTLDVIDREKLQKLFNQERNNSSLLIRELADIFEQKEGYVELFVIDSGIGVSAAQDTTQKKAFLDILNTEQRKLSSKEKNETKIGGIAFIGRLIEREKDFILNKDSDYWLGGRLPDCKASDYFDKILSGANETSAGCVWQTSFSWRLRNIISADWKKLSNESLSLLSLYKSEQLSSKVLDDYIIIDERIEFIPNVSGRRKQFENLLRNKNIQKSILYLPQVGMTKHLMGFVILPLIAKSIEDSKDLIIADIPEGECLAYLSALNEAFYTVPFQELLSKIPRIILITRKLSVSALTFTGTQYRIDDELISNFVRDSFARLSLYKILEVLITHDSLLIWKKIKGNRNKEIFINQDVVWDEETGDRITGFLDFNLLTEISEFRILFKIGLTRISGFYQALRIKFAQLDVLVDGLLNEYIAEHAIAEVESNFSLFVGSIFAKGHTKEEAVFSLLSDYIVIHCFQHPSSYDRPIFKLFSWADQSWLNMNFIHGQDIDYRRIGRTHSIAPGGHYYFKLPRYTGNDESFYYRNPKETYQDWQNIKIGLRIGNLQYRNNYDFINVDLKNAIEAAFYTKNELAQFLVANIFLALGGVSIEQLLDKEYWTYVNELREKAPSYYDNCSCVVYPNHPVTNLIMSEIGAIISDNLMEKVVPLNYIRNINSNHNHLFSPSSFKRIYRLLDSTGKQVLFFDDAIVSGRTRKEVKHLLFSFKRSRKRIVDEVKTLAILDRQLLPYSIPNINTHRYYWRLDIPRLGSINNNPLDNSINKANSHKHSLIQEAQFRIKDWSRFWSSKTVIPYSLTNTLGQKAVRLRQPRKKYSVYYSAQGKPDYKQIGGDANRIFINTSIGLICYCIEQYVLTGKDDLILKYINTEIADRIKIELISSYLLLFRNELRPTLRFELLRKLLIASSYSITDNHSSLAALTLINETPNSLRKLRSTTELKNNSNLDIQTAFTVSYLHSNIDGGDFDTYLNIISVAKTPGVQKLINLIDFHRQIYEKREAHMSPIFAVLYGRKELDKRYLDFRIALSKIKWHILQYQNIISNVTTIIDKIDNYDHQSRLLLVELGKKNYKEVNEIASEIQSNISDDILEPCLDLHSHLIFELNPYREALDGFVVGLIGEYSIERWRVIARERDCQGFLSLHRGSRELKHKIRMSMEGRTTIININKSSRTKMWIPMVPELKDQIKNFITNYLNGTFYEIHDPFSMSESNTAHLWYSYEYQESNRLFVLKFANSIANKPECLENAKNSRAVHHITEYYQLGCQVNYKKTDKDVLIAELLIPII